jgi:putative membrane protein
VIIRIILQIVVNSVALWAASRIVPGFDMADDVVSYLIVGLILGLVNAFIRPIARMASLPITLLTLGLFALVINTAMIALTAALAGPRLEVGGLSLSGLITCFVAAVIISLVSWLLNLVLRDRD